MMTYHSEIKENAITICILLQIQAARYSDLARDHYTLGLYEIAKKYQKMAADCNDGMRFNLALIQRL